MRFGLPVIKGALGALAVLLACAPVAEAAKLVGGHEQAVIATAFFARGAHRGQVIVSTRDSTVAPAWAIVKSVTPRRSGSTNPSAPAPPLRSTYLHSTHGRWRIARKVPPATRADLAGPFRIDVVYSGSGSESIAYDQPYGSVCAGSGGFTDQQDDTVNPMSWTVRYVVDLDALQSAVRGPTGTVLVPAVGFLRSQSTVRAKQKLTRTAVDVGCNGKPTSYACQTTYSLAAPSKGLLSFPAAGGLEIGVPVTAAGTGDCDPSDYTLGPSLWDSGATTVIAPASASPAPPSPPTRTRRWQSSGRRARRARPRGSSRARVRAMVCPAATRSRSAATSRLHRPGPADRHASPGSGSGSVGVGGSCGAGTVAGSGSAGVPGSGSIGAIGASGTAGVTGSVGCGTSSSGG